MKRNVLITGGSGNLGKAVVAKFLAENYNVFATVTKGKNLGYETSGDVTILESDLTNESQSTATVNTVISKAGNIDAALLLVGGFAIGGIADTDGAALEKMYRLNFETAYFTARPVFLQMMKQSNGGRIVLVGSRPSLEAKAGKGVLAYALSKSLLFKLAEYLNAEGKEKNVVTTVVVPSTIDTEVNRQSMPKADFSSWVKPDEIAAIMAFVTNDGQPLRETVLKIYGKA